MSWLQYPWKDHICVAEGYKSCFSFPCHMMLLCMLSPSVPVCEHSQNSNGGTLKEVLIWTGTVCYCIQNEFIVDSPCCCSEHTLATKWRNDSIFCNDFSWRRHFLANTIKNNFLFLHSYFLHTKIINILCFTFHFCTKQQTTTNQVRPNNSENEDRKNISAQKTGKKKHSMFPPSPQTMMCIQITRFTNTSLLCATPKLTFLWI